MPEPDTSPPTSLYDDRTLSVVRGIVSRTPAMLAYWDSQERCVFANDAYHDWFGRKTPEMIGISMQHLLGPIYEKNLVHIRKALAGEKQVFERRIPLPNGENRESIATYIPDTDGSVVRGFYVHVADVTVVRQREEQLKEAIAEVIVVLEKTKRSFHSKELAQLRAKLEQLNRSHA